MSEQTALILSKRVSELKKRLGDFIELQEAINKDLAESRYPLRPL